MIRHINIDGIDRNACCGTQVPNLTHCGSLHILPPSIPSDSTSTSKTPTRLSFTAGPRALRYLRHSSRQLSLAAQALGCGRSDLAERAARSEELRKEGSDTVKGLRNELIKLVTEKAVGQYDAAGGPKVFWVKRDEKSTHDFDFLGGVAGGVLASPAVDATKPVVVVTSTLPGKDQTHLILVQSNDQDAAKGVNEKIKVALDEMAGEGGKRVKGGGARGRFMSKVEGKWGKAEDVKLAELVQAVGQLVPPFLATQSSLLTDERLISHRQQRICDVALLLVLEGRVGSDGIYLTERMLCYNAIHGWPSIARLDMV